VVNEASYSGEGNSGGEELRVLLLLICVALGDLKIFLHSKDRRRFYTHTSICLKISRNHARSARTYFKSEVNFRQTSFRSISSQNNNTPLMIWYLDCG